MASEPLPAAAGWQTRFAIAWSDTATVGHLAVADAGTRLSGELARGLLDCRLHPAGKFRNGATRHWCVVHQCYWGVQADLARADGRCRAAAMPLHVLLDPPLLALPAGEAVLHLHAAAADGLPTISLEFDGQRHCAPALALRVADLFAHPDIVQLNLTPPALAALRHADGCVDCARCGYPHLDLGPFAGRAHRRHSCGQCGYDATHSGSAMVSNPLYVLRQALGARLRIGGLPP